MALAEKSPRNSFHAGNDSTARTIRIRCYSLSKNKAKGTTAETAVVNYLNSIGIVAVRNPPQGAKDKGDINIIGVPVVIEVKNCARMELSEWIKEAIDEKGNAKAEVGVVWHKKRGKSNPGDWYVTMTGDDFALLLLRSGILKE